MAAEEFVAWAMAQPRGRYELRDGEVVEMAAQTVAHVKAKGELYAALRDAVRGTRPRCEVFPSGMAVRVGPATVYEPTASVRCAPTLPDDTVLLDDPMIAIELISHAATGIDADAERADYLRLPSVRHVLIISVAERTVAHHLRGASPDRRSRLLPAEGTLTLDPPGIRIDLGRLFG